MIAVLARLPNCPWEAGLRQRGSRALGARSGCGGLRTRSSLEGVPGGGGGRGKPSGIAGDPEEVGGRRRSPIVNPDLWAVGLRTVRSRSGGGVEGPVGVRRSGSWSSSALLVRGDRVDGVELVGDHGVDGRAGIGGRAGWVGGPELGSPGGGRGLAEAVSRELASGDAGAADRPGWWS